MDDLVRQEELEPLQPAGLSARLPLLNSILEWLAAFLRPTKEEQENAGVYLGGEGRD